MQGQQGVARRFPLHQQGEPLGPQPHRHLVHLPVGGEEHQARLLARQQPGQGIDQLLGKAGGAGFMGHLGQIELGLVIFERRAQPQIAGAVVLLEPHLVAEIAEGGEGGEGGRDQHGAQTAGPEPLLQQITHLYGGGVQPDVPILASGHPAGQRCLARWHMATQHFPQGAETLQPLQVKTALRQQGLGLLATDFAVFERLADGTLHPVQRPQRLLARLLQVLRQHGQWVGQHPFGKSVVLLGAKQLIVAGEPLLQRLEIRLQGGQGILQLELGVEQALLVQCPGQLAGALHQFFQPAARPLDAGRGGAVIPGYGRQVVGLIQHIDTLVRWRQYDAAAHGEVGEQQGMVDHQHVGGVHVVPGAVEGAVLVVAQRLVATVAIGGDAIPAQIRNRLGPVVPVPVPLPLGVGLPQRLIALLVRI